MTSLDAMALRGIRSPHAQEIRDLIRDLEVAQVHGIRIITGPKATRYLEAIEELDRRAVELIEARR